MRIAHIVAVIKSGRVHSMPQVIVGHQLASRIEPSPAPQFRASGLELACT